LGADHRGFPLKEEIVRLLKRKRFSVTDYGTHSEESCDYPDFILKAAQAVARKKADRAIVVCHTGIGSAIMANKVKGVRAAVVQNVEQAGLSRAHNDSNVLVLGAGFVKPALAKKIVETWLKTPFEGGRHARRLAKITRYEKGSSRERTQTNRP